MGLLKDLLTTFYFWINNYSFGRRLEICKENQIDISRWRDNLENMDISIIEIEMFIALDSKGYFDCNCKA